MSKEPTSAEKQELYKAKRKAWRKEIGIPETQMGWGPNKPMRGTQWK